MRYGYDLAEDGKTLCENRMEQEAIQLMKELRGKASTLREIAAYLRELGIETKGGGEVWTPSTIKQILERTA